MVGELTKERNISLARFHKFATLGEEIEYFCEVLLLFTSMNTGTHLGC